MFVKVEVQGREAGAIFARPPDVLALLLALADACRRLGIGLVAFCMMTTHMHLVLEVPGIEAVAGLLDRIRHLVGQRRIGLAPLGEPRVEPLGDAWAVLRTAAYLHANPVTAGMVLDPTTWPWSSHRDVLGLRQALWYRPDALIACRTALDHADLKTWIHRRSKGSFPMPGPVLPPPRPGWPVDSLDVIAESVACWFGVERAAMGRHKTGGPMRRTVVAVARALGWGPREVGAFLGWSKRTARRAPTDARIGEAPVEGVLGLLLDPRLRPPAAGWLDVPLEGRGGNLLPNNRTRPDGPTWTVPSLILATPLARMGRLASDVAHFGHPHGQNGERAT